MSKWKIMAPFFHWNARLICHRKTEMFGGQGSFFFLSSLAIYKFSTDLVLASWGLESLCALLLPGILKNIFRWLIFRTRHTWNSISFLHCLFFGTSLRHGMAQCRWPYVGIHHHHHQLLLFTQGVGHCPDLISLPGLMIVWPLVTSI